MVGVYIVDGDGEPDGARAERIVKASEERGLLLMRAGAYGGEVVR